MDTQRKRRWFQALTAIGINSYIPAFFKATIFQGPSKGVCVPVLNCYSCPSALGACPIGALQNAMGSLRFNLSLARYQLGLYIIGFLGAVGSLVGRIPCGWLCPFGLFQELLYKIPSKKFQIPRLLISLKYIVLIVMVLGLPLLIVDEFGSGEPWFCKWICPAGTLEAGMPLVLLSRSLRDQLGFMFSWKIAILAVFLVMMIFTMRPFCRIACPLGAILGLFNRVSLFRMIVDEDSCTLCGECRRICPMDIKVYETPNSPDCIRCLKCEKACSFGSLGHEFLSNKAKETRSFKA